MRRIGLFPAIFALVLLALIVSQLVSAGLLVIVRPPPPAAMSVENVVREIRGEAEQPRMRQRWQEEEPPEEDTPAARAFGSDIARMLGLPAEDVRLSTSRMQRGRLIHIDLGREQGGPSRMVSSLVGDFTVFVRDPRGGWRAYSPPGEAVFDTVEQRFVLLFLVGALIMLPLALWMARRIALPFQQLAESAERLGRNPGIPAEPVEGPPEAERAGKALIEMARRLDAHVSNRTQMVAALAHDLRTPLTRVAFRVEQLPEKERGELLSDVAEMESMISATLDLVRGTACGAARERIELSSLIERVAEDLSLTGGEVIRHCPELLVVEGDPLSLRRMLSNLVQNALNYGGRAEVIARRRDRRAVIEILDEGPGLAPADLARVFEPFYRVEASRSRHTGGSGLGLPFARMVAEAHGGEITLENRPTGGLCAKVVLPLAPAAASTAEASPDQPRISATSIADQSVA